MTPAMMAVGIGCLYATFTPAVHYLPTHSSNYEKHPYLCLLSVCVLTVVASSM